MKLIKKLLIHYVMLLFMLFPLLTAAQKTVTGTVTDAVNKTAVEGATILVKGQKTGTKTDANGNFTIAASPGQTLVISNVGFKNFELKLGSVNSVAVALEVSDESLGEVVVVGYGKQKKVSVVGSIVTIQTKELKQSPAANLSNALVGRLPGLGAIQSSGEPGDDQSTLLIRGVNSFKGSNTPLVLVDGIQRSFANLDANEVESVSILKDASATAVYGVAGANGVILVTTRRGKEGPPQISLSVETSIQQPTRLPKLLNSYDFAVLKNEANANDGDPITYSADDLQKYKDGSDPYGHPDIDWLGDVLADHSSKTQYNLNIAGGNPFVKYFVNAGYLTQGGLFRSFPSEYDANSTFGRYNFRSNIDINLSKDMTIGLDLSGRVEDRHSPNNRSGDILGSVLLRNTPNAFQMFTPDGGFAEYGVYVNPIAQLSHSGFRDDKTSSLQGTFRINRKFDFITQGLSGNISMAFDQSSTFRRVRTQSYATYKFVGPPDKFEQNIGTRNTVLSPPTESTFGTYNQSVFEGSVNYSRGFGNHNFTGLVLYTQRTRNIQGAAYGKPFVNQGIVGRVTYNYQDKYFGEFNGRYDGSENFAKGNQWGFFPSMAVGWVVSKESFFSGLSNAVPFLKIRGSYGIVGNDQLGGARFLFQSIYGYLGPDNYDHYGYQFGTNSNPATGITEATIGNPDVTWEEAKIANIGLDAKFLKSKLGLTVDIFQQKRSNILTNKGTVPGIVGANLPAVNIGKTVNKGFEVELIYNDRAGKVAYFVKGNISYNHSEVLFQDEAPPKYPYQSRTGERIFQPFGLVFDGFFADTAEIAKSPVQGFGPVQPGDIKYKDLNGDGKINADDETAIGYSTVPEWVGGFSAGVNYKGFDFSFLLQGAANVSVYKTHGAAWEFFNDGSAKEMHLGRWTPANANTATYPRVTARVSVNNQTQASSFWYRDASYLRLKNLEIGYNLPKSLVSKIKIQGVRVYVNGLNLITWTDNFYDFDPEAPSTGASIGGGPTEGNPFNTNGGWGWNYPQQKIFNAGINVTF